MKQFFITLIFFGLMPVQGNCSQLPKDFVYLKDIDPSIIQEIRYAGHHNFVGRPIKGYLQAKCILTRQAANALKQVQKSLVARNMSLKVYDCYRPQKSVNNFIAWSKQKNQLEMKAEFYPKVKKDDFFKLGYVAKKSGHSRGSTVDVTIVNLPAKRQPTFKPGQKLISCTAPHYRRFPDNSIPMGTGYDCMDKLSHSFSITINATAYKNRKSLRKEMKKQGFIPYQYEWWHFTLDKEPFQNTYFNFDVK